VETPSPEGLAEAARLRVALLLDRGVRMEWLSSFLSTRVDGLRGWLLGFKEGRYWDSRVRIILMMGPDDPSYPVSPHVQARGHYRRLAAMIRLGVSVRGRTVDFRAASTVPGLLQGVESALVRIFGRAHIEVAFRTQSDEELGVLLGCSVGEVTTYRREFGMPALRCKGCRERVAKRGGVCLECAFADEEARTLRLQAKMHSPRTGVACRECGGDLGVRRDVCRPCAFAAFVAEVEE